MIQSIVKVYLASSVHSRGRLDAGDSTNHRVHSGPASMGAALTHLLHPRVLDESARERRPGRERLRDDQPRLFLTEIFPIDRIRSDYDRQLARTEHGTQ